MKRFLAAISVAILTLTGCAAEPEAAPQETVIEQVIDFGLQDAVIYEVNVRQFTPEGTFKAFQEHLPRIQELGVEILWLMPIHPISEVKKKGSLGSPYSVADYYGVNPEFGTEQDFRDLVKAAHDLDMLVILDWVANHTGWDHPWITSNPEWYTQDQDGNIVHPPGTDWTDVADLNFSNWEMRMAMIDAMKYWVEEYDIDGYRADVAHSVPVDFWDLASEKLHEIKDVFMLAEDGGDQALLKTAFDTNYAWPLKDIFNRLGKNLADAGDFRRNLKSTATQYKDGKYQMVFIDNHDENTWHGTVFERLGGNVANMAVISFTVPGMPLIYGGNEIGLDRRLEFFEKDPIIWPEPWGQSEWEFFYKQLVDLRTQNPALFSAGGGGILKPLHLDNSDVIAFARSVPASDFHQANDVIVIANIAPEPQSQALELGELVGEYTDWFSQAKVSLDEGQVMELEGNSYQVLVRSR
uniref:alpha-amylase family glycosyl hydrolase n=1 Tax=Aquiluna sp. TaxID=2053504 RepID=UPI00404863C0